jgi:hypothetical protein
MILPCYAWLPIFPSIPGFLRIEQLPWIWETPAPAIGSRFHTVPADSRPEGAFAPPVLAQPAGIEAKRTTLAEVPVLHWPAATPELMLTEVANVLQKLHSADSKFGLDPGCCSPLPAIW